MSEQELPLITDQCSKYFQYRCLIECGTTWDRSRVDNLPKRFETYSAIRDLCLNILDPVVDQFGPIELTYGFASSALIKLVHVKNARPNVTFSGDQHAGCELNRNGKPFCTRLGQAVDFRIPNGTSSLKVAHWVIEKTPFDRLYFYADDRSFHVSYGPEHSRMTWHLPKLSRH